MNRTHGVKTFDWCFDDCRASLHTSLQLFILFFRQVELWKRKATEQKLLEESLCCSDGNKGFKTDSQALFSTSATNCFPNSSPKEEMSNSSIMTHKNYALAVSRFLSTRAVKMLYVTCLIHPAFMDIYTPMNTSQSIVGFGVLPKDTLACRIEQSGVESPIFQLVDDLLNTSLALPTQLARILKVKMFQKTPTPQKSSRDPFECLK